MTLRAPPGLQELRVRNSLERAEWRILRATAERLAQEAQERPAVARAVFAKTRSAHAKMAVARAVGAARTAERNYLLLAGLWDTSVRVEAFSVIRLEEMDWGLDGTVAIVHDKGAPDGRGKRSRETFFKPETSERLRTWRESISPDGTLPDTGWLWPGRRDGPISVQAIEEIVHNIALHAGLQRYLPGGRTRASHRFLVTPHSIRRLAEDVAAERVGGEIAARGAGHTEKTAKRRYRRAGADHARIAALARADY